jgi:serine/threonine protein kinase
MLEIHPKKRITIQKALEHPFLDSLHNEDDEPVCDATFDLDFEHEELTKERIQDLIWLEIAEFHSEMPAHRPCSTTKVSDKTNKPKTEEVPSDTVK